MRKLIAALLLIVTNPVEGIWYKNMNPGMMLRVDRSSVNSMKKVFGKYLPNKLAIDLELPKTYMYDYNKIWGMEFRFTYKDISYGEIKLDMDDVKF